MNLLIHLAHRDIAPQVDDQAGAPGPQHAAHLAQRLDRLREVLERGTARDQVREKQSSANGHLRRVALVEVDRRLFRVGARNLHKRLADVESSDPNFAQRQLDRQKPRARRHLQHVAAVGQQRSDAPRELRNSGISLRVVLSYQRAMEPPCPCLCMLFALQLSSRTSFSSV